MMTCWTGWKRYPRASRGENIEAPISAGIYEVRHAGSGALFAFGAVDNLAQSLAQLRRGPRSITAWFGRQALPDLPELEYRTCATRTRADARIAAERMIGRRETYIRGAA